MRSQVLSVSSVRLFRLAIGTLLLLVGTALLLAQGIASTLFFGWLAVYLPELYPIHVRATGSGMAYNTGRFATAFGVLAAGALFTALGGSYPRVGTAMACIYGLGIIAIWWAPATDSLEKAA